MRVASVDEGWTRRGASGKRERGLARHWTRCDDGPQEKAKVGGQGAVGTGRRGEDGMVWAGSRCDAIRYDTMVWLRFGGVSEFAGRASRV